ncbi:MAG: tRNA (adenosine(37)-N6)-threonylcarbamoyltransferase complex dimerization subunit type 1 TsaB [Deltaproteobacteria bacterium]|nr:tRNA (adenosine(37)-N6)-threonylcarbamoyltransferase complex dimerization subunit type 1 TsaB [Deltaproteobacteria bacterium]
MLLLSIDTSGGYSSICIIDDKYEIIAENNIVLNENKYLKELYSKALMQPSTLIFKQLDYILSGSGLNLADIKGIAITLGPGSFTGIRVSLSIAKTLAYSLNLKIAGVESLYACAYSFINKSNNFYLTVIKEFIKDKFYFEIYKMENGTLEKFKGLETGSIKEISLFIDNLNIKSYFVYLGSRNKYNLDKNIQLINNNNEIEFEFFDSLRLAHFSGIIAINKFNNNKKNQSDFKYLAELSPVYVYSGGAF